MLALLVTIPTLFPRAQASTCGDALGEPAARRLELERLAAPRPVTWGSRESPVDSFRKILPSGWLVFAASPSTGGTEEIQFSFGHSNWAIARTVLRLDRRAKEGPSRLVIASRAPGHPVTLTVAKTADGFHARITATDGHTLTQLFGRGGRTELILVYDPAGRLIDVEIEQLAADGREVWRSSLSTPAETAG